MKKLISLLLCAGMLLSMASFALADDVVEVSFWSLFTGADGQQMNNIIDKFNAQDPSRKIVAATQDWDNYYTKVKTSIMGGEACDLMISHDVNVWGLIKEDMLVPIDTEAERVGATLDYANYSGKLEDLKYEDHYWAIPLDAGQIHLSYNKEILSKAGVLDEAGQPVIEPGIEGFTKFVETVAAACPEGMAAFCAPILNGSFPWYFYNSLYYQFGGEGTFVSDDGTQWTINDEIALKAAKTFVEIYQLGLPNVQEWTDMITSGAVAMCIGGSWQMNQIRTHMFGGIDNFGVAMIPQFGEKYYSAQYSHVFCLPYSETRTDEELKVVFEFLNFVAQNNAMWSEAGSVPAYLPSWDSELFQSFPMHKFFKDVVFYDTPKTYTAPFGLKGSTEINEPMIMLANGELTPEQWLVEIADRMNTALR